MSNRYLKTNRTLPAAIATIGIAVIFFAVCGCSKKSLDEPRQKYYDRITLAMENMRVGDWAYYFLSDNIYVRMQVIEKDSKGFTIEYLSYLKFAVRNQATKRRFEFDDVKRNLENGLDIYGTSQISEIVYRNVPMRIGAKEFQTTRWSMRNPVFVEQWFADDVPIWGMVRQNRNNAATLVIRTYGRAGDKIEVPAELPRIAQGESAP